jgi:ubiquinone/menaquinone biosynthesis C-methylase UbiE
MVLLFATALGCQLSLAHHAQHPEPLKDHPYYELKKDHHPQAIGKSYFGREIASVMGYSGVEWLERDSREQEEHLSKLIQTLPLKPGMVVADIGAGSGVIAQRIAPKVAPKGGVFAVDIQKKMLRRLIKKAKAAGITNIKPVLGSIRSPKLKASSVDLAIMVDVYHELSHPLEMMQSLSRALKPGGLVVLVEYRAEDPEVPIKKLHKMSLAQIKKELSTPPLGLKFVKVDQRLPRQHVVFYRKISQQSSSSPQKTTPKPAKKP